MRSTCPGKSRTGMEGGESGQRSMRLVTWGCSGILVRTNANKEAGDFEIITQQKLPGKR